MLGAELKMPNAPELTKMDSPFAERGIGQRTCRRSETPEAGHQHLPLSGLGKTPAVWGFGFLVFVFKQPRVVF